MTEQQFDPWALDTGLLNDVDFTVDEATFTYSATYNNGETLVLKLTGTSTDEQGVTASDVELLYPCGRDWEPGSGGREAVRANGARKGFNNSSAIGLLIGAAIESGAMDEFKSRGTPPHQAVTWEGLRFHLEQKEKDYGGEIGKKSRLLPTKFLGANGSSPAPASAPAANPVTTVQHQTNGGLSAVLKAKLKKLAGECSTHDEFIERAFTSVDGVDGNADAEAAVADETAIWAEVKG